MKWGIVSASRISHRFIQAIQQVGKDTVHAVAARDLDRAKSLQEQYGIPVVYDSYEKLYQDTEVEVVYISNVNNHHFKAVMQAIAYGKHVVCEKPLSVSAKEATAMIAAAEAKGVFLMEALWTRFLPLYEKLHAIIETGTIGEVQQVRADFAFEAERNDAWRLLNPALGGGALYDIGIYALMFILDFMGTDVKDVKATGLIGPTGVDEESVVTLDYGEGKTATAFLSFRSSRPRMGTIFGTKGQLDIPDFYAAEQATVLLYSDKETTLIEAEHMENKFVYEALAAHECIEIGEKESRKVPWQHSVCAAEVIDEALRQL